MGKTPQRKCDIKRCPQLGTHKARPGKTTLHLCRRHYDYIKDPYPPALPQGLTIPANHLF